MYIGETMVALESLSVGPIFDPTGAFGFTAFLIGCPCTNHVTTLAVKVYTEIKDYCDVLHDTNREMINECALLSSVGLME